MGTLLARKRKKNGAGVTTAKGGVHMSDAQTAYPEFRWLERGDGEPVVFLHEPMGRMDHWEHTRRSSVCAARLPCHCPSSRRTCPRPPSRRSAVTLSGSWTPSTFRKPLSAATRWAVTWRWRWRCRTESGCRASSSPARRDCSSGASRAACGTARPECTYGRRWKRSSSIRASSHPSGSSRCGAQ